MISAQSRQELGAQGTQDLSRLPLGLHIHADSNDPPAITAVDAGQGLPALDPGDVHEWHLGTIRGPDDQALEVLEAAALRGRALNANLDLVGPAHVPEGDGTVEGVPQLPADSLRGEPKGVALLAELEVELRLSCLVAVTDIPCRGEALGPLEQRLARPLEHPDVRVAEIDAYIVPPAARATLRLKGDLIHPLNAADGVPPKLDDLAGGNCPLRGRPHNDLHIHEALPPDIGLDALGDRAKVVGLIHAVGRLGYAPCDLCRLPVRRAAGQGYARLDLLGGHLRHHDHPHVIAVGIAAHDQQQG